MSVLVSIISLAKTSLPLIYKPDIGELAVHIAIDKVDLQGIGAGIIRVVHYIDQESGQGMESVWVLHVAAIRSPPPTAVVFGNIVVNVVEPAKAHSDVAGWCTPLA